MLRGVNPDAVSSHTERLYASKYQTMDSPEIPTQVHRDGCTYLHIVAYLGRSVQALPRQMHVHY